MTTPLGPGANTHTSRWLASSRDILNQNWREQAACTAHDPELWFPDPTDEATRNQATAICRQCPVINSCYRDAMRHEVPTTRFGILGGLTHTERETIDRRARRVREQQRAVS